MNIDYSKMQLSFQGKTCSIDEFKSWFRSNYQPIMHKYHIKGKVFDWQAILADVQVNGIIEIFKQEYL